MAKFFTRPDGSQIEDLHERGYLLWKEMFVGPGWYCSEGEEWYLDQNKKPIATNDTFSKKYLFTDHELGAIHAHKKFTKEEINRILKLQAFQ